MNRYGWQRALCSTLGKLKLWRNLVEFIVKKKSHSLADFAVFNHVTDLSLLNALWTVASRRFTMLRVQHNKPTEICFENLTEEIVSVPTIFQQPDSNRRCFSLFLTWYIFYRLANAAIHARMVLDLNDPLLDHGKPNFYSTNLGVERAPWAIFLLLLRAEQLTKIHRRKHALEAVLLP